MVKVEKGEINLVKGFHRRFNRNWMVSLTRISSRRPQTDRDHQGMLSGGAK